MSAGPPVAIPGKPYRRSGVLVVAMSPLALSLRFLQSQPDVRLVALARDGHAPAFEVIVRRYRKELLAYCRRLQPRWGSAEDALQQTLLQAWKALTSGAEVRELRPWLYRIAHNVVVSDLRSPITAPQALDAQAHGPEVDQLVEQRLRARAALDAMASLPTLQRQALVSTTFDGASRAEVAAALGLSHGAVRGLVYRARETLRTAAAAITPSPAVGWALRRAATTNGSSRATIEVLAGGGGGAGMAGVLIKGSAVITLAGAVAGTGSVLVPGHVHHRAQAQVASPHRAAVVAEDVRVADLAAGDRGQGPRSVRAAPPAGRSSSDKTRDGRGARESEHGGPRSTSGSGDKRDHEGSPGGQDPGRSDRDRGSSGGSDGGSISGGPTGGRGSSNGDGGSGGSGPGGTIASSGSSDGGGSGSGTDGSNSTSTTTTEAQMMTTVTTSSDGGSGSDRATSGGSGSDGGTSAGSGSGGTITTSGAH